ncbi:MAG TPA: hypothetical protein VHM28_10730 [Anaerolineales bacterium]|nr:hypothetical protein [Anaerolineales bacterium]
MPKAVNPWRVLVKGLMLFALFEYFFFTSAFNVGSLDVYDALGIQRLRFPTSTYAPEDAALDAGNLDAMFASHIVSQPKAANEFRVMVFGDSAMWGIGETPDQTLPGQLGAIGLTCDDKIVHVYNLSYPRSSATKDLMILDKALQYQPDLIVWVLTLYTLMPKTRVDHWLVTQNPDEFYELGSGFGFLPKDYEPPTELDKILAKQRALFRTVRYELYSLVNLAVGVDQIQGDYEDVPTDLSADLAFEGLYPPAIKPSQLSIDQVKDFYTLADTTPVILVNEPIMVLKNKTNSDVRYNFYYPRWVYDQYRQYLGEAAEQNNWDYLDLWDTFPSESFTNTPLHLNPAGERKLAEMIAPSVEKACP